MKKGYLISLEGGEGGGKSTQIAKLKESLEKAGKDVISVREPGGSAIAEQIREVVLTPKNTAMAFTTEVLLFQASRAQVYHEVVLPALEKGQIVLMDRTRDSSVVYQGIVRKFGKELIEQLNTISTRDTYPQVTLLLDISVATGLGRVKKDRKMDRIESEKNDFHQQVRDAYLSLAKDDQSGRWKVLDAEQDVDIVEKEIWKVVSKKLGIK